MKKIILQTAFRTFIATVTRRLLRALGFCLLVGTMQAADVQILNLSGRDIVWGSATASNWFSVSAGQSVGVPIAPGAWSVSDTNGWILADVPDDWTVKSVFFVRNAGAGLDLDRRLEKSAAWYFSAGFGLGCTVLFFGFMVRQVRGVAGVGGDL